MKLKNVAHYLSAVAVIAYMGLIYHLSSIPGSEIHVETPDYILHALAYGGLGMLMTIFLLQNMKQWQGFLASFVLVFIFALSDEAHQFFTPMRTPDWRDIVADMIGTLIVQLGIFLVIRLYYLLKTEADTDR